MLDTTATSYFISIIDDTIQHRQKHNFQRPDLIQLLIDSGKCIYMQSNAKSGQISNDMEIVLCLGVPKQEIIGQSIQFFAAGFDTSSVLLQFMAYELALHPNIQEKLQKEIDQMIIHLEGKSINYESIQDMKYMDMIMSGINLISVLSLFIWCLIELFSRNSENASCIGMARTCLYKRLHID